MKALIIGGTGTLGRGLAREILRRDPRNSVVVMSRCELKQKEMSREFSEPRRLSFLLGDIRDGGVVDSCLVNGSYDVVFLTAALKHVDVLEENPEESIKTNVLGTLNVADAAVRAGVPRVVFSSTDKAVDPINVYGMCKGIAEKVLLRRNETQERTRFLVYRWGNVVGSRGSVLQSFADTLAREGKAYITALDMTRFWIRIDDAIRFMLDTYQAAICHEVLIPEIKAASVLEIVDAVARHLDVREYEPCITGVRRGEKLHEALKSGHSAGPMSSQDWPRYSAGELDEMVGEILSASRAKASHQAPLEIPAEIKNGVSH